MKVTIPKAVEQLLAIVEELRDEFPKKRFTLDGRLVGDIGEALAEQLYALTVFDRLEKHHDAKTDDGRLVQVKATMQGTLTFPADHIPDYYLGLSIDASGTATEVFNGPGKLVYEVVRNRKRPKNNLHSLSVRALRELDKRVREEDRISRRPNTGLHPTGGGANAPAGE
jgi:hypothetical protein